ncbi:MAG: helix-turn-helix transcriptional regulator [Hyphomicrobiales bacterium]|nr:helix-turn-helix transcriptional regulator [Hyphomicrobiales bacterium]
MGFESLRVRHFLNLTFSPLVKRRFLAYSQCIMPYPPHKIVAQRTKRELSHEELAEKMRDALYFLPKAKTITADTIRRWETGATISPVEQWALNGVLYDADLNLYDGWMLAGVFDKPEMFGAVLKQTRKHLSLSGPKLHEATGIRHETISRVENSKLQPSLKIIRLFCDYFERLEPGTNTLLHSPGYAIIYGDENGKYHRNGKVFPSWQEQGLDVFTGEGFFRIIQNELFARKLPAIFNTNELAMIFDYFNMGEMISGHLPSETPYPPTIFHFARVLEGMDKGIAVTPEQKVAIDKINNFRESPHNDTVQEQVHKKWTHRRLNSHYYNPCEHYRGR